MSLPAQRSDSYSNLVQALSQPASYTPRPSHVERVQTHISTVFIADALVYKLKKPVRASFLDYSTLALRQHYCQEEVRLNQRLAPAVYLGVVPVWQRGEHYWVEEKPPGPPSADAVVVDYLVKMRRLPAERTLGALVAADTMPPASIRAVAERLGAFHATAATGVAAQYGTPEVIGQVLEENFDDIRPFIGQTLSERQFTAITTFGRDFLTAQRALFDKRVRTGRVRDGHGDLRCDHVYVLDEGIVIVDCIEFSPRLRSCDVASDLAFLAMDLELHGAPALAEELVRTYRARTRDEALLDLLPFYQCHRAAVRGKVASLKSREPEISASEQTHARLHAQHAFRLAARYARGKRAPALLIVCGRIGTGKSTVAQLLSDHTGFVVFNSDLIRKRLAGIAPTHRRTAPYRGGIYAEEVTRQTYARLRAHAQEQLRAGRGVIIDATCQNRTDRRAFLELGGRLQVPVLFVECRAGVEEVKRRLRAREHQAEAVSDATWAIAQRAWAAFPPFDDLPAAAHLVLDTADRVEDRLSELVERLSEEERTGRIHPLSLKGGP